MCEDCAAGGLQCRLGGLAASLVRTDHQLPQRQQHLMSRVVGAGTTGSCIRRAAGARAPSRCGRPRRRCGCSGCSWRASHRAARLRSDDAAWGRKRCRANGKTPLRRSNSAMGPWPTAPHAAATTRAGRFAVCKFSWVGFLRSCWSHEADGGGAPRDHRSVKCPFAGLCEPARAVNSA